MTLRTRAAALCAFCLLSGCGGGGEAGGIARDRVRSFLPKAEHIRCSSPRKDVTTCEVTVPRTPVGKEHWHCSFEDMSSGAAYSGSRSCWTEDGSQESLGKAARLD